jgi:hypothetical protein
MFMVWKRENERFSEKIEKGGRDRRQTIGGRKG